MVGLLVEGGLHQNQEQGREQELLWRAEQDFGPGAMIFQYSMTLVERLSCCI
jgi:hypothetical protein